MLPAAAACCCRRLLLAACCRGFNAGLTGNAGTNALVARAARSVLAAARQHAVLVAVSVVPGEDGGEDGDQVCIHR
jgi:hypothetical protein